MFNHYVYMNEAVGGDAVGESSAAPVAEAPSVAEALTPPEQLLSDSPVEEVKQEEAKPEDAKPEEKEEAAPIEYEEFTLPEGVQLEAEKLDKFKEVAASLGLQQEGAQQLVDMYASEIKELAEAPYKAWFELQKTWQNEIKSDPEIGGANLERNLAQTKAGLNAVLGQDAAKFYEALNMTGAGNNPAIVKAMIKLAAQHSPASPVRGNPASVSKSPGATLYPSQAGLGNGHDS